MSDSTCSSILIVDDEAMNRKLIKTLLAGDGYCFFEAERGSEALEMLARQPIDVIISDVMMPEMDGVELTRRIKADPVLRNCPMIVVTSLQDDEVQREAILAGAEDFLTRPVDRVRLSARVRNLCRLKRLSDDSRRHTDSLEALVAERTSELHRSERRFRQLARSTSEALLFVNADGHVYDANAQASEMMGRPEDSILGAEILDFFGGHYSDSITHLLLEGKGELCDLEMERPNGMPSLPVDVVVKTIMGAEITKVVAVRDVSERRGHQVALEQALQMQQLVYENLPVFMYVAEVKQVGEQQVFETIWVSENVNRVIAATHDQFKDPAYWNSRIHPDDCALVEATRNKVASGEIDDWHISYRWRKSGSQHIWLLDRGSVVRDESGGVVRLMGIYVDMSEQKHLESQLLQSQKMEAVGKLAGGVAHDFNNLLTSIISFAGFVRDSMPEDDPRRDDIREVLNAADRAVGLTRQLLAFSRQQPAQVRVFDLNDTLSKITRLLRRTLGEDIALHVTMSPRPAVLRADPTHIDQILLNLAVNARDAMPDGGELRLCIGVENGDHSSVGQPEYTAWVKLVVEDNGTGIDEETVKRIFEPFFTTKGSSEGTGLGLATCYGVVTQLHGSIEVESELGRGTKFTIYLPLDEGIPEFTPSKPAGKAAVNGVETILLVEDERLVRRVAERALREIGYTVLSAADAVEGLEQFKAHRERIDLVFSDVVLPRGNGYAFAAQVRSLSPELPILLTSGYTDRYGAEEDDEEFPVLWKPYMPESLASKVQEVLASQSSSRIKTGG